MRNRIDSCSFDKRTGGVRNDEEYTSELYLPKVYPYFGRQLYKLATKQFPVRLKKTPEHFSGPPDITYIIGHRGKERIPLLMKTLESIAAQKNCKIECVVVEQGPKQDLMKILPDWVVYRYCPTNKNEPYSRSRAFNHGASSSNASFLVFHDGDLLVPERYSDEMLARRSEGYDVVNIKRFIFFINEIGTCRLIDDPNCDISGYLAVVMQNAKGGGSIGVKRTAFESIGGFDDRFVGWGGEDNEFWDRACTRPVYDFGYIPLIHLWHRPQSEKSGNGRSPAMDLYWELIKTPPQERIDRLVSNQVKD